MHRGSTTSLLTAAALAMALPALAPAALAAEQITVFLDQAKIVATPENTSTIVVGNPLFVEVTMLKGSQKMVLTGKGFGETNLIVLDQNGEAISETIVHVTASEKYLIVQRGVEREAYHCNPRCQPTVALGDSTRFMGETSGQIGSRNSVSK